MLTRLFESGTQRSLGEGLRLFVSGDQVRSMFLLIEGQIDLVRHDPSGTPMILDRVRPGSVAAEASAFSPVYHCDGVAAVASRYVSLPVSVFRDGLLESPEIAVTWAEQLAHMLQRARAQSEIRSLKTVAQRLDAWLGEGNALPPKGQLQSVAHILGVSRESLYRELARRRSA